MSNKCCWACLKPGHISKKCRHPAECKKCHGKHATSLHRERKVNNESVQINEHSQNKQSKESGVEITENANVTCSNSGTENDSEFCTLPVVAVKVTSKRNNVSVLTYAFIDTGSSASFIVTNWRIS